MATSQKNHSKKFLAVLKITDIILPTLDEMKYFTALALLLALSMLDTSLLAALRQEISDDIRVIVLPIMAIYITYVMFTRKKLSEDLKLWACLFYYGFFALLAGAALESQGNAPKQLLSFEALNYWITCTVLIVSITRGIFTLIIFRLNDPKYNRLVTQNFHDTQYRPFAFILMAITAAACVALLDHFYDNPPTILALGFTYAGAVLTIGHSVFRRKLEH